LLTLLPLGHSHGAGDAAGGNPQHLPENDLFAGTDRQYTSGVKLGWSSPDLANYSGSPYASPFLPLFNLLPYINGRTYHGQKRNGVSVFDFTMPDTPDDDGQRSTFIGYARIPGLRD
jgi:hypothetical protein